MVCFGSQCDGRVSHGGKAMASSVTVQIVAVGRSWWQEFEVVSHVTAAVRPESETFSLRFFSFNPRS